MPPSSLDRFKDRFDCVNRGELEQMLQMYAEDAVFDVSAVFTDVAPTRGHGEIRAYWDELRETWKGLRIEPVEGFDLGDRRYVIEIRLWGEGRGSGIGVEQRYAFLYELRKDGKAASAQLFSDVDTALSAAEPLP